MENIERKKRFDGLISSKALEGFIIVDKNSENLSAVLKKEGEKVNHTLHGIITFCTCGFWALGWIIFTLIAKKEIILRLTIDESGNLIEEEVKR